MEQSDPVEPIQPPFSRFTLGLSPNVDVLIEQDASTLIRLIALFEVQSEQARRDRLAAKATKPPNYQDLLVSR
jgi:hypothetical protein